MPSAAGAVQQAQGQCLRPKTVVCYDREAFFYPPGNVRITLDRNVRSGLGSLDFLNPQARYVPVMEGLTVLEVKYDAFLPELIRMAVQVPNRRAAGLLQIRSLPPLRLTGSA